MKREKNIIFMVFFNIYSVVNKILMKKYLILYIGLVNDTKP